MIGAHNTFSYLKSENTEINSVKKYWKCQSKTIEELYNEYNVRFFDIRICKKTTPNQVGLWAKVNNIKKNNWSISNGLGEFDQSWDSIEGLFEYMKSNFPLAQYRIILEKGTSIEVVEFENEINKWIKENGTLLKSNNYKCSYIGIKSPWTQLYYDSSLYPQKIHDYCCRLFKWNKNKSIEQNINNFNQEMSIEKWAKKYNPVLTQSQIENSNELYFGDYIGVYGIK